MALTGVVASTTGLVSSAVTPRSTTATRLEPEPEPDHLTATGTPTAESAAGAKVCTSYSLNYHFSVRRLCSSATSE